MVGKKLPNQLGVKASKGCGVEYKIDYLYTYPQRE